MLKELLTNLKSWEAWDFSAFKIEKDDAEILIPILEKATPKKPLVRETNGSEIIAKCPNCGMYNHMDIPSIQEGKHITTHCPNCGQNLDWRQPYKML